MLTVEWTICRGKSLVSCSGKPNQYSHHVILLQCTREVWLDITGQFGGLVLPPMAVMCQGTTGFVHNKMGELPAGLKRRTDYTTRTVYRSVRKLTESRRPRGMMKVVGSAMESGDEIKEFPL